MTNPFPAELLRAAEDYLWLLSRGYPQKSALKMVGDRFMLSGEWRQVLYRGVSATERAEERKKKIGSIQPADLVLVDTYNVLFTVNNYLLGKKLFISNDGFLRDAGEMRGRIKNKPVFKRAIDLFLDTLKKLRTARFRLYLDEPVSFSGRLSIELSKDMVQLEIDGEAYTVPSPDQLLQVEDSDAICTSDSAIIDRYSGKVVDLPRFILREFFQPDFPSLVL